MELSCINCHSRYSLNEPIYCCRKCKGLLEVVINDLFERLQRDKEWEKKSLSVWKYTPFLPDLSIEPVTLNEGGTLLIKSKRIAEELKLKNLYIKFEGQNPTGSFKDRGMTVGVSKAKELGYRMVICASTGNTSSSLAAYAARGNLNCVVLVPSKKIAMGKLAQAIVHGTKLVMIDGNFDLALRIVMELCSKYREIYLLNSINPFRLEGQKTAAFEISEQLKGNPDLVILPVGNAGNISSYWKGFKEFYQVGFIKNLPRMIGIQAEGASPITKAIKKGESSIERLYHPETIATAIRIGSPIHWKKALNSIYESKGYAESVTDQEIISAQRELASKEGLFVEPASAASFAGLKKLLDFGLIDRDERIVCVATGHGLKDPDIVLKDLEFERVVPDTKVIERVLGLGK